MQHLLFYVSKFIALLSFIVYGICQTDGPIFFSLLIIFSSFIIVALLHLIFSNSSNFEVLKISQLNINGSVFQIFLFLLLVDRKNERYKKLAYRLSYLSMSKYELEQLSFNTFELKDEFKSAKLKSAEQSIHKKLLQKVNKYNDLFSTDELKDMEKMSVIQLQKVIEKKFNRR